MSTNTAIEWTDAIWNPVRGCSRVSEGCRNCYAERVAARFCKDDLTNHNQGDQPFFGFATRTPSGPRWTGKVEMVERHLTDPLHWRKPRKIFVNSMSDLFHEALPDEAIDRVFAVMALCPQHTFQVLTKRPERMLKYFGTNRGIHRAVAIKEEACKIPNYSALCEAADFMPWPFRNIWLGVSVEDQKTADERIPLLLQTPAAVRFVSYEPALGPVDLNGGGREWLLPEIGCDHNCLDWVIVGGESGPGARPFDIAWARKTVAQCKRAGVACFVKQLGADPYEMVSHPDYDFEPKDLKLKSRKGGDWDEWPPDLRVREFPERAQ